MGRITIEKNRLIFQRRDELTVVEPYGPDCLRCRSTKNGRLSDESWTLLPPPDAPGCTVEGDSDRATLTNGRISVTITDHWEWWGGFLTYCRDGEPILRTKFEGDYTRRNLHTGGDNFQVKVLFEANPGEHLYGLGQEQIDFFDRKGCSCDLLHYNTKSAVPVLVSSLGYGFLWNNPAPGRCETTNNHTLWVADSAYQADYLVYVGETPADILKKYCDLTGYPPHFPEWAAGFWQSKLRYESQDEVLAVVDEYQRRGIPLSAVVIDYFHWTEQGEWKFDPAYWPDPEGLAAALREKGVQPVVSVWPTINPASENFEEMDENNLLVRTENGLYGTFDFYGPQAFIDATNPKTAEFVWDKVKRNYYDRGFRNFWLDEAEPEVHPQQFSNLKFYLGNGAQTAMVYPYYYNKLFHDGLRAAGEDDVILLTRAAWPGIQKFGSLVWNGDILSSFDALRMSVKTGLSMAMSGIPWWNSDIGGFIDGDIESSWFRELIVRWAQFGVFCPVMRFHGSRRRPEGFVPRHPGVKEPSGGDNELWSFGERDYHILKGLVELRERLRPYICACMEEAEKTGLPIMRPMFLEFHEDPVCWELDDQYLFGPDILFAPVTAQGQTARRVYLPAGRWTDVNTRQTMEGGRWVECCAPLERFIAFVREGAPVLEAF